MDKRSCWKGRNAKELRHQPWPRFSRGSEYVCSASSLIEERKPKPMLFTSLFPSAVRPSPFPYTPVNPAIYNWNVAESTVRSARSAVIHGFHQKKLQHCNKVVLLPLQKLVHKCCSSPDCNKLQQTATLDMCQASSCQPYYSTARLHKTLAHSVRYSYY